MQNRKTQRKNIKTLGTTFLKCYCLVLKCHYKLKKAQKKGQKYLPIFLRENPTFLFNEKQNRIQMITKKLFLFSMQYQSFVTLKLFTYTTCILFFEVYSTACWKIIKSLVLIRICLSSWKTHTKGYRANQFRRKEICKRSNDV